MVNNHQFKEAPKRICLINDPDSYYSLVSINIEMWKNDPKLLGEYVLLSEFEELEKINQKLRQEIRDLTNNG